MKFGDYSPTHLPPLEQQRDALKKGLGRVLHWALSGRLEDEPLLEACLRDQRFDAQLMSSRGNWLWQMVQGVGATERFRVPVLHALYELSNNGSAEQLCELAFQYAKAGDEAFRAQLYEIVERKPVEDSPWLGEEEIVALDGEQAFLAAARVRGKLLLGREWEWDDGSLIEFAAERFGAKYVENLLETATDEAVNRFREHWRQDRQKRAEKPNRVLPVGVQSGSAVPGRGLATGVALRVGVELGSVDRPHALAWVSYFTPATLT